MANKNPFAEGKLLKESEVLAELGITNLEKKRIEFNEAVFELGLTLIEDYRTGRCRDAPKTLDAIIEIFKVQATGNAGIMRV